MKLKQALSGILNEDELNLLVGSYDMVGDIAITIIPPELETHQKVIGEAILSLNRRIKVVAKRAGVHQGEYRILPLTVIAGEDRKETEHKEFGVRLAVNPELTYFSVRSSTERKRIADLVKPGENVMVMFSGIGPFPLVIARLSRPASVIGIEKNSEAHAFAVRNLRKNKLAGIVSFIHGDVREILPKIDNHFDRIIMPLPGRAAEYLELALSRLNPDGWLHVYSFQPRHAFKETANSLSQACSRLGRHCREAKVTPCGHCSPSEFRICVDLAII